MSENALHPSSAAHCQQCLYFVPIDEDAPEHNEDCGWCRRHAPIAWPLIAYWHSSEQMQFPKSHSSCWPIVWPEDWCGEFRDRESDS